MGLDVYVSLRRGFLLDEAPTLEDADPSALLGMKTTAPYARDEINAYVTDAAEGKSDPDRLLTLLRETTFDGCGLFSNDYGDWFVFGHKVRVSESRLDFNAMEDGFAEIQPLDSAGQHEADERFKTFCRAIGVPYEEPGWYLVADVSA